MEKYGEIINKLRFPTWEDIEDPDSTLLPDAASIIEDLLARAGTAEKENAQLKKDLSNWSYNCKAAVERAQHFKRERDAAVSDLRGCAIESCAECMYCLYRTARSFCSDCTDGSNWRWKGAKEG